MTNVPAGFGTTLSYVVLAIVIGMILFATGTLLYYRRKWAAEHRSNGDTTQTPSRGES